MSTEPPQWGPPPADQPRPEPPMRKGTGLPKWAVPLIVVVGVLVVAGVVGAAVTTDDSSQPSATTLPATRPSVVARNAPPASTTSVASTTTTTREPAATTTTVPRTTTTTVPPTTTTTIPPTTTTAAKSPVIPAGTYVVNTEIAPGVYRVASYWARLDANQEIIDNDLVGGTGMSLVNVQPGDAFIKFAGSALAIADSDPVDPIAKGYDSGTYLVGFDIQPGRYRVSGETAYAARLTETGDIIDNDLGDGSVIMTVQAGDWAFTYSGRLESLG